MTRRRALGLALTGLGLALLLAMLVVLFATRTLGVRFAVAVGLPGGLLGVLGVVMLLAEGEFLAGEDKSDRPDDGS